MRAANRWGQLSGKVLEDLEQETYLKLCADRCRLLLEFAVQHPESVAGYIKVIAINLVHDHFKAAHSQKRGAGVAEKSLTEFDAQSPDMGFGSELAIEREILMNQINVCLQKASTGSEQDRDQLIFWMYYRQGLSAKAIAGLPGVGLTDKGVEAAIFRLTRKIREQLVQARGPSKQPQQKKEPGPEGILPSESY